MLLWWCFARWAVEDLAECHELQIVAHVRCKLDANRQAIGILRHAHHKCRAAREIERSREWRKPRHTVNMESDVELLRRLDFTQLLTSQPLGYPSLQRN